MCCRKTRAHPWSTSASCLRRHLHIHVLRALSVGAIHPTAAAALRDPGSRAKQSRAKRRARGKQLRPSPVYGGRCRRQMGANGAKAVADHERHSPRAGDVESRRNDDPSAERGINGMRNVMAGPSIPQGERAQGTGKGEISRQQANARQAGGEHAAESTYKPITGVSSVSASRRPPTYRSVY